MSKALVHGERHPHVVLLTNDIEDNKGVCELISSQIEAFRALVKPSEIQKVLLDSKPSIVLLGYNRVISSVQLYAELIEKKLFNYKHKTILLCDNKESGVAFKCCTKGLFDDYFVHKPMYENFRLRLILQNMLKSIEGEQHINRLRDEHFGKIDESLSSLIDEVVQQQEGLKDSFENTRTELKSDNSTTDGSNETNSSNIDPELYNILRDEYLHPLLSSLEGQISNNIVALLSKLNSNKQVLKNCSDDLNNHHLESIEIKKRYSEEFLDNEQTVKIEKHVMVVDDNEMYREMICKILRDEGYKPIGADSGKMAIESLNQNQISAIFMDLYMPGLDGYNTTRNIRSIKGYEKLPIIALTGNRDKEMIRKWAQHGLNGYIAKPATKFAILAALKKSDINPG